jgi:hypothetical protein
MLWSRVVVVVVSVTSSSCSSAFVMEVRSVMKGELELSVSEAQRSPSL